MLRVGRLPHQNCMLHPEGIYRAFPHPQRICPSGSSSTQARSMGRGAGPSKLTPSLSYPLPWQGHLNFVLAFVPVRRTAKVRTHGIDHKEAFRIPHNPDPIILLKAGVHTEPKISKEADLKNATLAQKECVEKKSAESSKSLLLEIRKHKSRQTCAVESTVSQRLLPCLVTRIGSLPLPLFVTYRFVTTSLQIISQRFRAVRAVNHAAEKPSRGWRPS